MKKEYVFDIESNGLLDDLTTIHCIVLKDVNTQQLFSFEPSEVEKGLELLSNADHIIGHNIIKFDIPAIQKVYPEWKTKAQITDTILCSRLIWSDIKDKDFKYAAMHKEFPMKMVGRHSLESWGYRLDFHKGEYGKTTDWSEWTPEMQQYCEQDVHLNSKLYEVIQSKNYSETAVFIEHEFQNCIKSQEDHGFFFDVPKAQELYTQLQRRRGELYNELQELFPQWEKDDGIFVPKRNNKTKGYVAGKPVQKTKTVIFNPNSNDHIADRLKNKYNWKPKEFTKEGKPRIDETVLASLPYPEAKQLAEYKLIQKRIGMLAEGDAAWLKVVKDNFIHGQVITNGAVTGRCTHKFPNIAQVPSVSAPYGKECRELFSVPDGYKLVGVDVSGLELRCLAHYLYPFDNGAMVKELLEGDIHTANQKAAGLPTRNDAKTFIYAFIYGAGDTRLGEIVGGSIKEGKQLRKQFLTKNPALGYLKNDVEAKAKRYGFLNGIDKRQLPVRSVHSALNTLLQSCGAIIVKRATILLDSRIKWLNLQDKASMVAHVHDEMQLQVIADKADEIGKAAVHSIKEVQHVFQLNCPLDGEYKVGSNWAMTH